MELWDVYDKDRMKTGRTIERGPMEKGDLHMVVNICLFNSLGEMLIQQRQPFKQGWSNMWDITVGGSAVAGDSSQTAAQRELFEEIGYAYDFTNIRPHLTVNFDYGFDDIYLIEADVDIDTLHLQYEEVQQVKWATKEQIWQMIDDEQFIPYHKSLIELVFQMRHSYGTHIRKE